MKFLAVEKKNSTYTWTYRVQNISAYPATKVRWESWVWRGQEDPESTTGPLLDLAPGAAEYVTVSCAPKAGLPPCKRSAVNAWFDPGTLADHNFHNNSADHGLTP